jgi:hypothetical protein
MSQAAEDRLRVPYHETERSFLLPAGWTAVGPSTLDLATRQAWEALSPTPHRGRSVAARMSDYYRIEGNYAGATFCEVEPNDPFTVTATDLWAVTTLSVKVPPREGRRLLEPGRLRTTVHRHLRRLPVDLPLTDLEDGTLDAMYDLYSEFREVASTADRDSNWWVFASKLCARKRPELFPVRDALVCGFLSGGRPLGGKDGQLGWFAADIQVFANLISNEDIRFRLRTLQSDLDVEPGVRADGSLLRLLDAALWTYAKENGGAAVPASAGSAENEA